MLTPVPRSSGNPIADRRYDLALALRAEGDHAAAADLLAQTVAIAPDWPAAWFALGEAQAALGGSAAAVAAFRRVRDIDPTDELGAGLRLARLGEGAVADAMAAGYVESLFDQYAAEFESAVVGRLGYVGPQLLRSALIGLCGAGFHVPRCLDLGCGTGLAGTMLRPHCTTLVGIDLAGRMLALAAQKRCYDALIQADLLAALAAEDTAAADLIVAADALVYVGELGPVFAEIARVLTPAGLFAFTAERCAAGIELHATLRYRHGVDHIRDRAASAGLTVARLTEEPARSEAGAPVPGFLGVLAKPPAAG